MKLLRGSFFHRRKRDGEPLARHLLVRSPPEPPNVPGPARRKLVQMCVRAVDRGSLRRLTQFPEAAKDLTPAAPQLRTVQPPLARVRAGTPSRAGAR